MALTDPELWNRLMAFQYGTPEAGGLVDRVIAAQGVEKRRARRLVDAYLRFIYLVAASDEVLAPSKPVDEVWHLHLEDDAGYRDVFCGAVVGRLINHNEGRPSPAKDPAYQRTLIRYREEFDRKPDAFLWPVPARSNAKAYFVATLAAGSFGGGYLFGAEMFYLIGTGLSVLGVLLWAKTAKANATGGCSSGCVGFWSGSGDAGASDGGGGDGGGGGCGGD